MLWAEDARYAVSIHAPVKGATRGGGLRNLDAEGFNPRTREGCDFVADIARPSTKSFNPRTREGCDVLAPTPRSRIWSFNPRTREGCDAFARYDYDRERMFQSTHP